MRPQKGKARGKQVPFFVSMSSPNARLETPGSERDKSRPYFELYLLSARAQVSGASQLGEDREGLGGAAGSRHERRTLMVLTSLSCMTGSILSSFLDMTQLATRPSEEMLKKFSSLGWSSLCQYTFLFSPGHVGGG